MYAIYKYIEADIINMVEPGMPIADDKAGAVTATPYDRRSRAKTGLTHLQDILEFDAVLSEVTAGFSKPITMGSVLRNWSGAWGNWGIVLTDENRAELLKRAAECHPTDEQECGPESTQRNALREYRRRASENVVQQIETTIACVVMEMVRSRGDAGGPFRILELGAGQTFLSPTIAAFMRGNDNTADVLPGVEFHLVNWTGALHLAETDLRPFEVSIVPHALPTSPRDRMTMPDDKFLATYSGEKFDFVVMSCQMHRKPLISEYLERVGSVLKEDGVFISGDWHSAVPQYPFNIAILLRLLGVDSRKLDRFAELVGPYINDSPQLSKEEIAALSHHFEYWGKVATELTNPKYGSQLKVRMLSAFTTSAQMKEEMTRAGLETDVEKLRATFPKAKLPRELPLRIGSSDTAAVNIGMKGRVRG